MTWLEPGVGEQSGIGVSVNAGVFVWVAVSIEWKVLVGCEVICAF